jgi:hypothetical protein
MGALTGGVGWLSTISSNPVIAPLQETTMVLIIPGLLGSAILGGNVHAFSLAFSMVINGVIYFGAGWLLYPVGARIRQLWNR